MLHALGMLGLAAIGLIVLYWVAIVGFWLGLWALVVIAKPFFHLAAAIGTGTSKSYHYLLRKSRSSASPRSGPV